ncbi:MAG: hypothetical protein HONBIEJF_02730 [Fimbriimonadaceae bacterium]|nr:hypothetical protein [Fimbriimonadaceae bacterium]
MRARNKVLGYAAFLGVTVAALTLVRPKPDIFTISHSALASSTSGLLTALGGFSITVLAVLLGLEALDFDKDHGEPAAHGVAVRHVALSLAVACMTCFVGANLMAEVSAQGTAIDSRRGEALESVRLGLESSGVAASEVSRIQAVLVARQRPLAFDSDIPAEREVAKVAPKLVVPNLDQVVNASPRRLFIVASLSAYLASLVILQALSFLLRIRFPRAEGFTGLQNFAVLGIGAILLVKVAHTASYGIEGQAFVVSRVALFALMAGAAWAYAIATKRTLARTGRVPTALEGYTPLAPYTAVLTCTILSAAWLAATFANAGPPTWVDRCLVMGGAGLCTALLLVIQLEQPTIDLLTSQTISRA